MKFQSLIRLFGLFFLIFSFVGCMDVRAVDKSKENEAAPTVKAEGGTHFVFPDEPSVQTLAEPHKYQIVFPVHEDGTVLVERETQTIDEKGETRKTTVMRMLQVEDLKAVDREVEEGIRYIYRWGAVQGKKIIASSEKEIVIPTDVVIEGERNWDDLAVKKIFTEKMQWGRVFFMENSILTTQGQNLFLKANQILSNNATVRSFPRGQTAKSGDGKSGGKITLISAKAEGFLKFELRGEDGGEGLPGKAPDASLKGVAGLRGYQAVLEGRQMGVMYYQVTCQSQPTNGSDGFPGRQGFAGQQGGRGGDTAALEIQIANESEFHAEWIRDPGHGGNGGEGGLGGAGGDAGQAGLSGYDLMERQEPGTMRPGGGLVEGSCRLANPGHPGPQGPRGNPGDRGFEGRTQPVCLWKDSKRECQP